MQFPHSTRLWQVLALALLPAACFSDDVVSPGLVDIHGEWDVVTLDGDSLPVMESFNTPQFGRCTISFRRMELHFRADQSYYGVSETSAGCEYYPTRVTIDSVAGSYRQTVEWIYTTDERDPTSTETPLRYALDGNELMIQELNGLAPARFILVRR